MRFWFVFSCQLSVDSCQFHPKTGRVGLNFQIYHIFFQSAKKSVFFDFLSATSHKVNRHMSKEWGCGDITKKETLRLPSCDPGGARTLDPLIKSQLLYQLSYGVIMCAII